MQTQNLQDYHEAEYINDTNVVFARICCSDNAKHYRKDDVNRTLCVKFQPHQLDINRRISQRTHGVTMPSLTQVRTNSTR